MNANGSFEVFEFSSFEAVVSVEISLRRKVLRCGCPERNEELDCRRPRLHKQLWLLAFPVFGLDRHHPGAQSRAQRRFGVRPMFHTKRHITRNNLYVTS
jgi:hypothetical protein